MVTNVIEGLNLQKASETMTLLAVWGVSALLSGLAYPAPALAAGIHSLCVGFLLGFITLLLGHLELPVRISGDGQDRLVLPRRVDPTSTKSDQGWIK